MPSRPRHLDARYAFALLVVVVAVLCVDLRAVLPGQKRAPGSGEELNEWNRLGEQRRKVLETEYATVAAEIKERDDFEHLLFALKFALVGGILFAAIQAIIAKGSIDLDRSRFTALVVWAAVVTATIVDLRVAANQEFLGALGRWVRRYEELQLGGRDPHSLGWEAFLANQGIHKTIRLGSQVLTALLFGFSAALFLLRKDGDNDPSTALISGTCAILSIVLMTIAASRYQFLTWAFLVYGICGIIGIAVTVRLARASCQHYQPASADK